MRHGKILETVSAEDLHRNIGERHEYTKLLMSASALFRISHDRFNYQSRRPQEKL